MTLGQNWSLTSLQRFFFFWDKSEKFIKYLNVYCFLRFINFPLSQWKGHNFLLPEIRLMTVFSEWEFSQDPEVMETLIQMSDLRKNMFVFFWGGGGDQILYYILRAIFISWGSWWSICTVLFPDFTPLCLRLTVLTCSAHMFPKGKVLMSNSFPTI